MTDTMPSHRRLFAAFVALAAGFALFALPPGLSAAQDDRSPPPEVVVLARSDNPADALGAGPVAGILGAPVLVTAPRALLDVTAEAIQAADPDLVILAGGQAALSVEVDEAVNQLGYATRRAAGADRHETAAQLAGLLAEYNTGRPLLSGTPITAEVIPGLNAEELGGMTVHDLLAAVDAARVDDVGCDPGEFVHAVEDGTVRCLPGVTPDDLSAAVDAVRVDDVDCGPGEFVHAVEDGTVTCAPVQATPLVLRDHDPDIEIEHSGMEQLVLNTLTVSLEDHCGDGATTYQVVAESTGVVYIDGSGEQGNAINRLQLEDEEHTAESFEWFAQLHLSTMAGEDTDIATLANKRLLHLGPGDHELESAWSSSGFSYKVGAPTLYATVHGWSCDG